MKRHLPGLHGSLCGEAGPTVDDLRNISCHDCRSLWLLDIADRKADERNEREINAILADRARKQRERIKRKERTECRL